jgi:hypothetical protein
MIIIKNKTLNFFISTLISFFITTTPYILALTGQTNLFGTLLTFIVEPFVLVTTVLSFLIIIFSPVTLLADFFGILNSLSVKFILIVAGFGGDYLPVIDIQISKIILLFYYMALFLVVYFYQRHASTENDIIEKNESI